MSKRWALLLVAIVLILILAVTFVFPAQMVSPGPLSTGHSVAAARCFACHTPWRGASNEQCIACHVLADIGLRTTTGTPIAPKSVKASFHKELMERNCLACHGAHRSVRPALASQQNFNHRLLRPAIQAQCSDCHTAPDNKAHRDLKAQCGQCHQQEHWKPASFDHDQYFKLDDEHNTACVTCHTNDDYSQYTCYSCHEHSAARMRAKHEEEGVRFSDNCIKCHRSADDDGEHSESGGGRQRDD